MDDKSRAVHDADALMDKMSREMFGISYSEASEQQQMWAIEAAIDTFSARERAMADEAKKREREG
jgi:hypothetical protein